MNLLNELEDAASTESVADEQLVERESFDDADDRRERMEASLEVWVEQFADISDEARTSREFRSWLDVQSRFHDYSYRNTLLIQRQCPGATRVAGYQTWREEFDRQVSKGESAIWIWAPIVTRRCPECENGRSWHERRGCEYDAMPPSEWERALVGFKPVPVFDVSQTDGEALPKLDTRTTSDGDASRIFARLLDAASDLGVDASVVAPEEWTHGAADGVCTETPRGSQVRVEVLENENAATMASVLAHEYAHALLHSDVEDAGERAKRELEAESVAYVVSRYLGLDASRSALYVAAWHREPADAIRDRLERIVDTTREIIDAVEAASTIL